MKTYKAGTYQPQSGYKSFTPAVVDHDFNWSNNELSCLHGEAMRFLGELQAYTKLIPNINFFIKMNVVKEATKSNLIEGTQTRIDEAVLPKTEIIPEKKEDWSEVQNYIKAMDFAVEKLKSLPLSVRLLKDTHKILLSSVRGSSKAPGELRKSQNWIGGSTLQNASFIPPSADKILDLLSDLEKFWHNKNINLPFLIKIAITHYQFETIHPFLDGNGRVGRLLIILQLIDSKILTKPSLYPSNFFEKNKSSYFDSLTLVRTSNDLNQWIKFFLTGIIASAKDSVDTFKQIIVLQKKYDEKIIALKALSKNAQILLLFMFSHPIVSTRQVEKELKINFNSANRLLKKMTGLKILKEKTGFSRNRLFVLEEYLNLFTK